VFAIMFSPNQAKIIENIYIKYVGLSWTWIR